MSRHGARFFSDQKGVILKKDGRPWDLIRNRKRAQRSRDLNFQMIPGQNAKSLDYRASIDPDAMI
jgi:hypothetical protein